MKKSLLYIFIFLLSSTLYSLNFKTIKNSELYTTDGYDNYYSGEIKKNEIVKMTKAQIYYGISDWKYSVEVIYKNKEYLMNIEDLTPEETQITFDNEISLLQNDEYRWIPVFGYEILYNQNRDLLCKKQPKGFDKYQKQKTEFDYEWYDTLSNTVPSYFFNSLIKISLYFNNCSFLIKSIKKYDACYLIEAQVYDWSMPDSKYNFTKLDNITLKLSLDGDYLNLFCNDSLLGQFVKTNIETRQEIESLLKNNTYDISKVTWPLHADGSCDYDGTKKSAATNVAFCSGEASTTPISFILNKDIEISDTNMRHTYSFSKGEVFDKHQKGYGIGISKDDPLLIQIFVFNNNKRNNFEIPIEYLDLQNNCNVMSNSIQKYYWIPEYYYEQLNDKSRNSVVLLNEPFWKTFKNSTEDQTSTWKDFFKIERF